MAALTLLSTPFPTHAAIDPLSGIDLVRIGAVGNAAWQGNGFRPDESIGRGAVNYAYSIGKFEVTTAQWVEFFNSAYDRPQADWLPHLLPPTFWGARSTTPNTPDGRRWTVPAGNEMLPVGNISWRMAAMYCNWLNNGKSKDRDAFLNGAYDVSTFFSVNGVFQDQPTHNPDAKYWIPTFDEWLKAAHYDPNKANSDGTTGGYWVYSNGTDRVLRPGKPPSQGGNGQANYGFSDGTEFSIPLGAYSNVTSPWGLYDVAGGTNEWLESITTIGGGMNARDLGGSWWSSSTSIGIADSIYAFASDSPFIPAYENGFRIASSVPSPANVVTFCFCVGVGFGGRKRKGFLWKNTVSRRSLGSRA